MTNIIQIIKESIPKIIDSLIDNKAYDCDKLPRLKKIIETNNDIDDILEAVVKLYKQEIDEYIDTLNNCYKKLNMLNYEVSMDCAMMKIFHPSKRIVEIKDIKTFDDLITPEVIDD